MKSELSHDELQILGDVFNRLVAELAWRKKESPEPIHGQLHAEITIQAGRITGTAVMSRVTKLLPKVDKLGMSGKNRP